MLLKSGEQLISEVSEMIYGDGEDQRVIGYYLTKPCAVIIKNPNLVVDRENDKKTSFQVSLYPWMPLSADEKIPVPADWLVTLMEPTIKLKEMYIEDVVNYGKETNKDFGTDKSADFNQSN
jgi:hypothetical protein